MITEHSAVVLQGPHGLFYRELIHVYTGCSAIRVTTLNGDIFRKSDPIKNSF